VTNCPFYFRSTRWNPQIYSAAGYVTVAINPHGSTGYGQEFCDAIRKNWGSHPYYDLEKGLSYVIENFDFVDEENIAGLGASYGGFMINWINGHSKRFKVLVNHDGMFSTINSFYTTDELYFPEREVRKFYLGGGSELWNRSMYITSNPYQLY
jgi:dipeptidyl aminopeptidase/acylaminoacyl peptidase